jgi:ABC-2 type transport system ATP-binding protein/ribosome-dependent ATPase
MNIEQLIETLDVTKNFGYKPAVDGVSMSVGAGEVVGLLGANGAGKTTVIRMLLGLTRPSSGSVLLLGDPPSRAGRRQVGYVPQGLGLYPDLTVGENLEFVAQSFGVAAPEPSEELAAHRDRLIGDLSLGIRRRVAFEAAISHSPRLLMLDEPTSGVGPLGRARLWDAIDAASSQGVGVLVSTHYMAEAEQCDRVVVMASGRVVAAGTTDELRGAIPAVAVTSSDWRAPYGVLDQAGMAVSMVSGTVRVGGETADHVEQVLRAAGVDAVARAVPATFDEAFVALARR